MSEPRNHTIRQPLRFEDKPILYTAWKVASDVIGAFKAHQKPVKYGPTPSYFLTWMNIHNTYKCGKSRALSRFRALTWSVYPYEQGDIKPDYT